MTGDIATRLRTMYDNLVISLNFIVQGILTKADKVAEETIADSGSALTKSLYPNKKYIFTSRTHGLTLTLNQAAEEADVANEYHLVIYTGSTAPSVTWPTYSEGGSTYLLSWNGGSAPTIAASKVYEVSIMDGKAAFMELDPNTTQS